MFTTFRRRTPVRAAISLALVAGLAMLGACKTTPAPVIGPIAPAPVVADGQDILSTTLPAEATLNPGDKISVTVFREADLSLEDVPIAADGSISMPLIGTVTAAGQTTAALSETIRTRLAAQGYLRNPQVAVNLVDALSHKVTVEGGVTTPGVYDFVPGERLSSAIAKAAGPNRTAKLDQVAVFRRTAQGMSVAKFDYFAVQKGTMMDPVLQPGDRVIVGTSALGQVWQDILQSVPVFAVFNQL